MPRHPRWPTFGIRDWSFGIPWSLVIRHSSFLHDLDVPARGARDGVSLAALGVHGRAILLLAAVPRHEEGHLRRAASLVGAGVPRRQVEGLVVDSVTDGPARPVGDAELDRQRLRPAEHLDGEEVAGLRPAGDGHANLG